VYYATLKGDNAYAAANEPSLFTKALLRSFQGAGSEELDEEDWRVNTSSMKRAVDFFMSNYVDSGEYRIAQVPTTNELTTFEIHRLTRPPLVPVYVVCDPETDTGNAELVCVQGANEVNRRRIADIPPDNRNAPWELDLPYGEYHFEARFPAGGSPRSKDRMVFPVAKRVTLAEES
jgi:hypothetical protein